MSRAAPLGLSIDRSSAVVRLGFWLFGRTPTCPWLSSPYFTLVGLTLSLPFICLAGRPLFGDVWWVMASGRVLFERGQLPQADPFTFAPHTQTYFDVQWLAQLAYYLPYRVLGLEGVALFNAGVVSLTFGLLLSVAWKRSRSMPAASVSVLLAELTALWFLHPRAQTLAFATFAATSWLLLPARPLGRTLVGLSLVEALWANLHGSFFLGPLLTSLMLGGEVIELALRSQLRCVVHNDRVRFLALAVLAQMAGTLLTPYGPSIYTYVLKFSLDPIIRDHIAEWLPTTAADWPGAEFFASVALTCAVVALARSRVCAADLLVVGLFAVLGTQAYRNIPWWALASGPILATYLTRIDVSARLARIGNLLITSKRQVRGNLIRGALLGAVLVAALPWSRAVNPWLPTDQRSMIAAEYPVAATNFLAAHAYGSRVLSEHPWGAYIDWWVWPRYQPMIDPSIEVHPPEVWVDILMLAQGHASWEELADRYGVDVLMLQPETQALLIQAVERSPRWQSVYRDEQSVIYVRANAQETVL